MQEHAEALLQDGGDKSVVTGVKLLQALEVGLPEDTKK